MIHVHGRDECGVREENLGVGHGLMREEDNEGRTLLMQDCAECEVDLGKTGCPAVECIVEHYV